MSEATALKDLRDALARAERAEARIEDLEREMKRQEEEKWAAENRADEAERERDLAHVAIGEHEETYLHMRSVFDARVERLEAALRTIQIRVEDANQPYERLDVIALCAAALEPEGEAALTEEGAK